MEKRKLKVIVLIIVSALFGALCCDFMYRIMPDKIYMHTGIMPQRIYLEGHELRIGEMAKEMVIMEGGKVLIGIRIAGNTYYSKIYAGNMAVVEAHVKNGKLVGLIRNLERDGQYITIWYDKDAKMILEKPIVFSDEPNSVK